MTSIPLRKDAHFAPSAEAVPYDSAAGASRLSVTLDGLIPATLTGPVRRACNLAHSLHSPGMQIGNADWNALRRRLDSDGFALLQSLLTPDECLEMIAAFDDDSRFRKHVDMTAEGYGRGEYKYFRYPLPDRVASLRAALYERLAPIANAWNEAMNVDVRFPAGHAAFLDRCHAAGQERPTPLLLRYVEGDFNNLHQDVYGEHVFPLQVALLLSGAEADFTGGEFVLTEEREDAQARPSVVPLDRGDAVIFAVRERPAPGGRAIMRHGVSTIRSGRRSTLGVIFHDAK